MFFIFKSFPQKPGNNYGTDTKSANAHAHFQYCSFLPVIFFLAIGCQTRGNNNEDKTQFNYISCQ